MREMKLSIFVSPGFLCGLLLLLLNDLILKATLHNWITGKLSDFAGLFVFPLFWSALFPRFRLFVYFLTGITFFFWKSIYSQPLIDAWNGLAVLPLARTVDATDLLALLVLPFSFIYYERARQDTIYRLAPYLVICVSLFAFTATSFRTEFTYDNKYFFQEQSAELTRKMYHLEHLDTRYGVSHCSYPETNRNNIKVEIPADFCFDDVEATLSINEAQGQTVLGLEEMEHRCPEGRDDKQKLLAIFEKQFIEKLKQLNLAPSSNEIPSIPSPQTKPQPRGIKQLYFVAVGKVPDVSIEELAAYFRRKYRIAVKVLPELPLTDEVRHPNFPNSRPVAARLIEFIARKYPKVAENPNSVIIGITKDMTVEQEGARIYNFTLDLEGRFAVIATEAMSPSTFCEPANKELLETRLRKVTTRTIGTLYFHLPKSDNPQSVLYANIGCVDELDYQGEDF